MLAVIRALADHPAGRGDRRQQGDVRHAQIRPAGGGRAPFRLSTRDQRGRGGKPGGQCRDPPGTTTPQNRSPPCTACTTLIAISPPQMPVPPSAAVCCVKVSALRAASSARPAASSGRASHRAQDGAHDVRHRRRVDPAVTEIPRGLLDQRHDDAGREVDRPDGQQAGGPRVSRSCRRRACEPPGRRPVSHRRRGRRDAPAPARPPGRAAGGDGRGHAGQRMVDSQTGRLQTLAQVRDQRRAKLRLQHRKVLEMQVERALRQLGGLHHRLHRHGGRRGGVAGARGSRIAARVRARFASPIAARRSKLTRAMDPPAVDAAVTVRSK